MCLLAIGMSSLEKCLFRSFSQSKTLYDPPPKVMQIKTKSNKWDLTKFKSFCTAKETISKVKRQPSEWEKITANEATDKELISKIYKQLLQLYYRKIIMIYFHVLHSHHLIETLLPYFL